MGKYNGAVITAAGQNLFASAIAGGEVVTFTTMVTSSYAYPTTQDFEALTEIRDVVQTENISYAGVYGGNVVQVSGRFDNSAIEEPYLINTIGMYAQLGSNPAVLVAVVTAVTPDQMPVNDPESPSAFIFNIQLTIQNASQIDVTVNSAGTVTVEQFRDYQNKINSYLIITVPIDGWTSGSDSPYEITIQNAAIFANSVPFPYVYYNDNTTRSQKKAIDKSAALFTKLYTNNGSITVKSCGLPSTPVQLALRGV